MTVTIRHGDCREILRAIPDRSIHCCVTSPPYFGLRNYGIASWNGGDPACSHRPHDEAGQTTKPTAGQREHAGRFAGKSCHRCGAERVDAQIGLEQTPDAYVAELVAVFREVRRVLRDDGTLWLNLGDSYNAAGRTGHGTRQGVKQGTNRASAEGQDNCRPSVASLKPKDLIGIPWRVAFALQQDGWYLRQDIIWHKPNPMPESVTDRCTKAHEYIFLLTKSERYYYDRDAIAEELATDPKENYPARAKITGRGEQGAAGARGNDRDKSGGFPPKGETRNKRSVWTVTPKPFKEAHFATFPPALIEPCIKAGCPAGGTVLDPFGGAGTTGLVADGLRRNAILIELNPEYAAMAERRIKAALV